MIYVIYVTYEHYSDPGPFNRLLTEKKPENPLTEITYVKT